MAGWAEHAAQHVYREEDLWPRALSVLELGRNQLGLRGLSRQLGVATSTLGHAFSGRPPLDRTKDRLIHAASIYARIPLDLAMASLPPVDCGSAMLHFLGMPRAPGHSST